MDGAEKIKEDKIDLIAFSKDIWSKRLRILKITLVFILAGLIIAFTSKVEYQTVSKLLPESEEAGPDISNLGGLASLAGFDLSGFGVSGGLSPELFPEIVNSAPFLEEVIHKPIYFEKLDTTISTFEYFKEYDKPSLMGLIGEYTIGLPGKIKKLFIDEGKEGKGYDLKRYSKADWEIYENLQSRINASVSSKTGIISVKAEMPDAVAAAMISELLIDELTKRIIAYKKDKSQRSLDFILGRFDEAKAEYESKERQLARFTDQNRNISNPIVQVEYKRLENQLNIAFEVYKSLATQYEQAKIKVQEDTLVFTVLEPVKIPSEKSSPRRGLILVGFMLLGILSTITYYFIIQLFKYNVSK